MVPRIGGYVVHPLNHCIHCLSNLFCSKDHLTHKSPDTCLFYGYTDASIFLLRARHLKLCFFQSKVQMMLAIKFASFSMNKLLLINTLVGD